MGRTVWDDRWLAGLERVALALLVLAGGTALVSLAGWALGWLLTVSQISGVAFVLAFALYLDVGGGDKIVRSKVGMAGLALLGLSLLVNLADVFFEMDAPAWDVTRGVVIVGFVVCFLAYAVIRYRQRRGVATSNGSER